MAVTAAQEFTASWERFFRTTRRIRARANRAHLDGLSLAQFQLLKPLAGEAQPVGGLAESAGVAPPTATRMLDGLARDGLVERPLRPRPPRRAGRADRRGRARPWRPRRARWSGARRISRPRRRTSASRPAILLRGSPTVVERELPTSAPATCCRRGATLFAFGRRAARHAAGRAQPDDRRHRAPEIVDDLGGMDHYSWVFTAYLLATTVTRPDLRPALRHPRPAPASSPPASSIFMAGGVVGADRPAR